MAWDGDGSFVVTGGLFVLAPGALLLLCCCCWCWPHGVREEVGGGVGMGHGFLFRG